MKAGAAAFYTTAFIISNTHPPSATLHITRHRPGRGAAPRFTERDVINWGETYRGGSRGVGSLSSFRRGFFHEWECNFVCCRGLTVRYSEETGDIDIPRGGCESGPGKCTPWKPIICAEHSEVVVNNGSKMPGYFITNFTHSVYLQQLFTTHSGSVMVSTQTRVPSPHIAISRCSICEIRSITLCLRAPLRALLV